MLREWPAYLALVTSFFTVLIMWVHHHIVFRLVRRADVRLMFVNGLLLLFISVVPFPTAVMAEYLGTPAAPSACTLYAGFFVGISICFQLLVWQAAFRANVLAPNASPATVRAAAPELLGRSAAVSCGDTDGSLFSAGSHRNLYGAMDFLGRDDTGMLGA